MTAQEDGMISTCFEILFPRRQQIRLPLGLFDDHRQDVFSHELFDGSGQAHLVFMQGLLRDVKADPR